MFYYMNPLLFYFFYSVLKIIFFSKILKTKKTILGVNSKLPISGIKWQKHLESCTQLCTFMCSIAYIIKKLVLKMLLWLTVVSKKTSSITKPSITNSSNENIKLLWDLVKKTGILLMIKSILRYHLVIVAYNKFPMTILSWHTVNPRI
jgi:hypothetical protein